MELNQTSISYYNKSLRRISHCTETTDAIVPDTFPDIRRIVCAYGTAAIKDQTPQNDRIIISGNVKTTVLYEPEEGEAIQKMLVPVNFAHIIENTGIDVDTKCFVVCEVASVEATAVNSRKINVTITLCFHADGYQKTFSTVTGELDIAGAEQICSTCALTLMDEVQSNTFTLLDDSLMDDAQDVTLLQSSCKFSIAECRAMTGKVVLKGDAIVTCLVLQPENTIKTIRNTTPFTQILEMEDLDEGQEVLADLSALDTDCRIEPDGLLSYTITACALFKSIRNEDVQCIEDLYIPGKELQFKEESQRITSMHMQASASEEISESLQLTSKIAQIVSCNAVFYNISQKPDNSATITMYVTLLYLDDEQRLFSAQRILSLSLAREMTGEIEGVTCEVQPRISAQQEVTLLFQLSIMFSGCSEHNFRHITEAEVCDKKRVADNATLVVKRIDGKKALWDIAKDNDTTVRAIRSANTLDDTISAVSDTMLLIPIQA